MFVKAILEVAGFTRAIHSISRNFGDPQIQRGSAMLFFINNEGYALTCKHVAQWISQADQINKRYAEFQVQGKTLNAGQKAGLAKKLGITTGQTPEMGSLLWIAWTILPT